MNTTSIDSLLANNDPYTVTASLENGGLTTTEVTGDRTTDSFADAADNAMGKMDFLTLLTTQLKYQDPMEPQDNTEFVAQLAQFSQLETMSNVGQSMENLETSFTDSLGIQSNSAQSLTNASAVSLIGKEVRLRQNSFDYSGTGNSDFRVQMGEKESVIVNIMDDDEIIRSFEVSTKDETNAGTFSWDGTDELGERVMPGTYDIHIQGQEEDSSLYCFVEDTVSGLRYTASGPVIKVDGRELPVGNILEVNTVPAGSASAGTEQMSMSQALGLVGKDIKYNDYALSYTPKAGGEKTISVDLGGTPAATVLVKDGDGNVAHQFLVDNDSDGTAEITIPMDDKNGTGGVYKIEILDNPNAFFYKEGEISGVVTTSSGVKLKVNGMQISATDILEVSA